MSPTDSQRLTFVRMAGEDKHMTLQFDANAHRYTLNGIPAPSVTTILEGVKLSPPYAENITAMHFGTAVHKACELQTAGKLDENRTHPEVVEYVAGFKEKCAEMNIRPIATELRVFHGRDHYAGTLDLWCHVFGDDHALIDFKSGSSVPRCVELQLAGYGDALIWMMENGLITGTPLFTRSKMPRRFSMQLTPGRAIVREYTDPHDYEAFRGAVALYKWIIEKRKTTSL